MPLPSYREPSYRPSYDFSRGIMARQVSSGRLARVISWVPDVVVLAIEHVYRDGPHAMFPEFERPIVVRYRAWAWDDVVPYPRRFDVWDEIVECEKYPLDEERASKGLGWCPCKASIPAISTIPRSPSVEDLSMSLRVRRIDEELRVASSRLEALRRLLESPFV